MWLKTLQHPSPIATTRTTTTTRYTIFGSSDSYLRGFFAQNGAGNAVHLRAASRLISAAAHKGLAVKKRE
eukprot:1691484-Amphidinium_carterae.1